MAERIQLKDPGSEFVMAVMTVKPEVIERNDYYLFGNNGINEILVPQSSVKAQLERLGVADVSGLIGRIVRFGRSTKMSRANKPYWDIDWASGMQNGSAGGDGGGKPTNTGTSASASPAEPKPTMRAAYLALTEWVLKEIAPLYEHDEYGLSPEGIASCVNTLFTEACNAGKLE